MKQIFTLLIIITQLACIGQNQKVLFTVNKEPVTNEEFKRVYEKNLELLEDEESKNIDKYLELYINYKLKVNQAYTLQLDTVKKYKKELELYSEQLAKPYLQDKAQLDKLVKEAYDRTINEVQVSHILVRFIGKKNDTVALKNKIDEIRNNIIKGKETFESYTNKKYTRVSKIIGENLGYFSGFRMLYPFENVAYNTKVGEISKSFKTKYGYHILKVMNKRKSRGEYKVAHILISDKTKKGENKINSIYEKIKAGENFKDLAKKYSEDKSTAEKGGEIKSLLSTGMTAAAFDDAMYNLKKDGDFSKPIKTYFGWHIIKLIKNYPVKSFEELEKDLLDQVKRSERINISKQVVLKKLQKKYTVTVFKEALKQFVEGNKTKFPKEKLQKVILQVNERKLLQSDFSEYIQYRTDKNISELFEEFKDAAIIDYYKDNLEKTEPNFKYTIKEYKDGLLLFDLMEQKIWKKSQDSTALESYFKDNKRKYKVKKLDGIKGQVMNDYQKYLENEWVKSLRKKASIKINKKNYKKFKKKYNQ